MCLPEPRLRIARSALLRRGISHDHRALDSRSDSFVIDVSHSTVAPLRSGYAVRNSLPLIAPALLRDCRSMAIA